MDNPVIWLSMGTLAVALGLGVWQLRRVWGSQKKRGEAKHASNPMDPSA